VSIDGENAAFWNELCGSHTAEVNGFKISTLNGQDSFDKWYFEFYPYLDRYLDFPNLSNCDVVEVGLGLGTVSRFIAKNSKSYTGVDVAPAVCKFVEQSLMDHGTPGEIINSSILEPIEGAFRKFDIGIAIGSLHHTGDLKRAISNLEQLVKEDGQILIMVYNHFEISRVVKRPIRAIADYFELKIGNKLAFNETEVGLRAANDSNSEGIAAPHTEYATKSFFNSLDGGFRYSTKLENFHQPTGLLSGVKRTSLLGLPSKLFGTDIYAKSQY
jgi:SAM-dependent methyltransferase